MFEKLGRFMQQIGFESVQLPAKVNSFRCKIVWFSIISVFLSDALGFASKVAEMFLGMGMTTLAGIFLVVFFGQRALLSLFEMFFNLQEDNYKKLTVSESTKVVQNLAEVTKAKVFKEKNNVIERVETAELIKVSQNYIEDCWNFSLRFPLIRAQILSLVLAIIFSFLLELKNSSARETIIMHSIILLGSMFYFKISNKRIQAMREFRKIRKKNNNIIEVLTTEMKSKDFISRKDFAYHAERLRKALDENIQVETDERFKLNTVFLQMSLIASTLMIIIVLIKFDFSEILTIQTFASVITFSNIGATILARITSITNHYEKLMDIVIDIDTLYEDFKRINDVYEAERNRNIISTPVESLSVTKFSVSQDKNGSYELINDTAFKLVSGDCVMAYGRTGSGKSTLINLFTGKMSLVSSPINFSNGKTGYLNSIGYQTDKAMVNHFVINEIALTDNLDSVDRDKLFAILKGLKLYEELLKMIRAEQLQLVGTSDEDKIFEFLKIRKTKQFSSGQMQRLALVKLLYSLDESIQLVALDEPFNRLDDSTCRECMQFVKDYVLRDGKRILILATHQVEICRPYSNVEISFIEDLERSIIKVIRK